MSNQQDKAQHVRSSAFRRPKTCVPASQQATQVPKPGAEESRLKAELQTGMYKYRKWTPEQRAAALEERQRRRYPLHGPPHLSEPGRFRIITGTCYEHAHFLDSPERLAWFETELLNHMKEQAIPCAAWVVLSNHYHLEHKGRVWLVDLWREYPVLNYGDKWDF